MHATRRRSVRRILSILGVTAITGAGFVVQAAPVAAINEITLTNGTPIVEHLEGTPATNQLVARFTDSGNITILAARTLSACDSAAGARYGATIDWLGNGTAVNSGVVSCSSVLDQFEVHGSYTYKDSGTFNIKVTVTDTADQPHVTATGTTDSAVITDQSLRTRTAANVSGTEGSTVTIHAPFWDNNPAYDNSEAVDPGLTATIDWGDGTTSAADRIDWHDSSDSNVMVTGKHVYDANQPATKAYNVKVTLTDDGIAIHATDTLTATIADAALTAGAAKSFVATGAQTSTPVVASFTDAAGTQAKAADFTATVNWGDGATSAGTITQTAAGAFNVSGTHTYTTAGTKSLAITVTDEEGKTLSITATATVPALPTTGQPQTTSRPATPLIPLALLLLGLVSLATVGRIMARLRR